MLLSTFDSVLAPAPFHDNTRILVLGSYPPRQCGIATFTKDLVDSMTRQINVTCNVIAVEELAGKSRTYGPPVCARLRRDDGASYADIAARINADSAHVLLLQHEFGLFGGQDGDALLDLLVRVSKRIVITLHTILPHPSSHHREVATRICKRADAIVVLSTKGKEILKHVYDIDSAKIHVIAHGVPDVPHEPTAAAKGRLEIQDRMVISTFGLLSRGKGIEYAIEAMPAVVARHPEALYLILGQTHPGVREHEGEGYRESLQSLIASLDLQHNVAFVDRYLGLEDLLEYLGATDVYLTPYLNSDQIVSGTLAYAVGCGKAIVSTPYLYAQELLAQNRGVLCGFREHRSIAVSLLNLLDDPGRRHAMEREAYRYGRLMTWPHIAVAYTRLVRDLASAAIPLGQPWPERETQSIGA